MNTSLLTVCVAAVFLIGCADTFNGKSIAEPEVVKFHERLKARDFNGMYAALSEDLKAVAPKERMLALFDAMDRKLGPLESTEQVNWNVNTHNLTTTVVLVQQSAFRDGTATETFTFRVEDNKAELVGYNINSFDMLIK